MAREGEVRYLTEIIGVLITVGESVGVSREEILETLDRYVKTRRGVTHDVTHDDSVADW